MDNKNVNSEKDALLYEILGKHMKEEENAPQTMESLNAELDEFLSHAPEEDSIRGSKKDEAADAAEDKTTDNASASNQDDAFKDVDNVSDNEADDFAVDYSDLEDAKETVITKANPLPRFGAGGIFIPIVIIFTAAGVVLGHIHPISYGVPTIAWLRYLYIGFGLVALFLGINLIINAISTENIFANIFLGKLVTTGVYSKTRNPMYAGLIFISTGILFFSGNAFMYILPVLFWWFLSFLMQKTEEVILLERFGRDYMEYMNNTYRIAPFSKNSDNRPNVTEASDEANTGNASDEANIDKA